jgi:DNA-binding NarL/FixJ family response regulator
MSRSTSAELSVLISEDHPTTRLGIKQILRDEYAGAVIGEAGDAETTLAHLRSRRWSVLVLDISLPDRNGLELLREVKAHSPSLPVLVYSAHGEDQFGAHAARVGASGYLTKERAPEELCEAVRTVLRGGRYGLPSAAGEAGHEILSARERQVLRLTVAGHAGKAIAGQLGLSQKTVSTYRARLLRKLRVSSVAALVRYAIEHELA